VSLRVLYLIMIRVFVGASTRGGGVRGRAAVVETADCGQPGTGGYFCSSCRATSPY